ncbi:hypothetical protein Tco_1439041 [Tanacetum coccineum]
MFYSNIHFVIVHVISGAVWYGIDVSPSDMYSVLARFGGVSDWDSMPWVMAALVICISSDLFEESLVAPEVGAVFVTSPAGELDLVNYSSSAFDPSQDSLPPAPEHESLAVHDVMVSRWRDKVASRPSSPSGSSHATLAPSSEFLVAPIIAPPKIYSSSSGSSSDSSSNSSSLGSPSDSLSDTSSVHSSWFDASGQTHSGPSTRVASSRSLDSFSLFARPSYKGCRSFITLVPSSTPISRPIDPTRADLLPPRKRFRDSYSPKDSRKEHMEIGTTDVEVVVDLGISDRVRAHNEDGISMGVKITASDIRDDEKEFEAEVSAGGTVEVEVDPRVRPVVDEDVPNNVTADGAIEAGQMIASRERASLTDRIRRLGRENLKVRALLCIERDQDMTITCSEMTPESIEELIAQRVAEALANYEETRAANALSRRKPKQNGNDGR